MARKGPTGEDDAFFSELLSQFAIEPAGGDDEAEEDPELAAFLEGLDRGSKESEEAEVRSLLEQLPSQILDGPLSSVAGVAELLGMGAPDYKSDQNAEEILAAFADPSPEPVLASPSASSVPPSDAGGTSTTPSAAPGSGASSTESEEPPAGRSTLQETAHHPDRAPLPPRTRPPPAALSRVAEESGASISAAIPRAKPAPAEVEIGPSPPLTLKDLFGFDPSDEGGADEVVTAIDVTGPRQALASRRLYHFFLDHIQGRLKLSVLRHLLVTSMDRLSPSELGEAIHQKPAAMAAPLKEMVHDGLLIEDRGRYSLNPRSRNVLLMASLVVAWQDPERGEEISDWLRAADDRP